MIFKCIVLEIFDYFISDTKRKIVRGIISFINRLKENRKFAFPTRHVIRKNMSVGERAHEKKKEFYKN